MLLRLIDMRELHRRDILPQKRAHRFPALLRVENEQPTSSEPLNHRVVLAIEPDAMVWDVVPEEILPVGNRELRHRTLDFVDVLQEVGHSQLAAVPHRVFKAAKPFLLVVADGEDDLETMGYNQHCLIR